LDLGIVFAQGTDSAETRLSGRVICSSR